MLTEQPPSEIVLAATRITEELLRENFLLSDVTAEEFNKIAAIITRYLGATTPAARFVNAFEDAAKKAHIGFRHNAAWIACDWIECSERRAMVEQLRATTPLPSETAVGGEGRFICGECLVTQSYDKTCGNCGSSALRPASVPVVVAGDDEAKVVRSKDVMNALNEAFDELGKVKMPANQVGLEVYRKLARVPEFHAEGLTKIATALGSGEGS